MLMMSTAKRVESSNSQLKIPNNSIDSLIKNLELVRADKRKNANAWVRNTIPAIQFLPSVGVCLSSSNSASPLASSVWGACKAEFRLIRLLQEV